MVGMVIRYWIRILDHFSISVTIVEYGILGDLVVFLIWSLVDIYDTRQNLLLLVCVSLAETGQPRNSVLIHRV